MIWCLKFPLATKPKELVTKWPLNKNVNLEGCNGALAYNSLPSNIRAIKDFNKL